MTEQLPNSQPDPEAWLHAEAHGDPELYSLLLAKEDVGQQYIAGEIEDAEKRQAFDYLNQHIAERRRELGLDPWTE